MNDDRKAEIKARVASGEMTRREDEDFTWLLSELEKAEAELAEKVDGVPKDERIAQLKALLSIQAGDWSADSNKLKDRIDELEAENFKQEGMLHSRWEIVQRQEADIKRLMGNEQILHATMKKDVQRYKDAEAEVERLTAIICRVCKLSKDNCGDCPYHIKPSGDGKDGRETQVAARREKKVPETRKGDEAERGDATGPQIPPAPNPPEGETVRLSLGSEVLYEGPESDVNPNLLKIFKEMRPSGDGKGVGENSDHAGARTLVEDRRDDHSP